jgi:hypothetical protein
MVEIKVIFEHSIVVPETSETVFSILADVPDSVAHFPDLEDFAPHGQGYLWTLKKSGFGKFTTQLSYACIYRAEKDSLVIDWEPVKGVGNASVRGRWKIQPQKVGCRFSMYNETLCTIAAPRTLRRFVEPVVKKENHKLLNNYLLNLEKTFTGGNGRQNTWSFTD